MLFLIVLSFVNFYFDRLKLSIILIKLLIRIVFWFFAAGLVSGLIASGAVAGGGGLAALLGIARNAVEEQLARLQLVLLRSTGLLPCVRLTVTIFSTATSLEICLSSTAAAF